LAIGIYASATGYYEATAIGAGAYASGDYAIAFGPDASAQGTSSIALGHGAQTDYYSSGQIAIGTFNDPVPDAALMIGNGTGEWAYNPNSGNYEQNRSNLLVLMNDGSLSLYNPSNTVTPAISFDTSNPENPQILINGENILSSLGNGFVGGTDGGTGSFALGYNASVPGENSQGSLAIGNYACVSGDNNHSSLAIGEHANASGFSSTAIGHSANASGDDSSIAIGNNAFTLGGHSIAMGSSVGAWEYGGIALGRFVTAQGTSSIAIGEGVLACATNSIAIGSCIVSDPYTANQIVIGRGNDPVYDAAFMIGNGTGEYGYNPNTGNYEENRSNLLVLMNDGKLILKHRDYDSSSYDSNASGGGGEALRVKGGAAVEGKLLVRPSGDLGMGNFTYGEMP
jgi:hypothetical protein